MQMALKPANNRHFRGLNSRRIEFLLTACTLALIFASCRTLRPVETVKTEIWEKDSVATLVRDSLIPVPLPQDKVFIEKELPAGRKKRSPSAPWDDTPINMDAISKKEGILTVQAGVTDNRLWVNAWISDSILYYQLDSARIETRYWKERYEKTDRTVTVVKTVKKIPKWIYGVGGILAAVCFIAGYKIRSILSGKLLRAFFH